MDLTKYFINFQHKTVERLSDGSAPLQKLFREMASQEGVR